MKKKYIFNPYTLSYEQKEESPWTWVLRVFAYLTVASLLVFFYWWLFCVVLGKDLPKTYLLKRENVALRSGLEVFNRQLDLYSTILYGIEERDNHVYRSIFGLDTLVVDAQDSGSMEMRFSNIRQRLALRSESLDSIAVMADMTGEMVSHVPAIPPICPSPGTFRISSRFGMRADPISGRSSFHRGVDFATRRGNRVYATADGVIETAGYLSSGYGNTVLINHGFGFKTRYGHLRTIGVAKGSKVQRGDLIGTVGNTGRSTGPHLHYEVLYKGNTVNPSNYMDMDIPVGDYRRMTVDRKKEEEEREKKSTVTELLRRRK